MDTGRTLCIPVSLKTNYNNLGTVQEIIISFILTETLYYHILFNILKWKWML